MGSAMERSVRQRAANQRFFQAVRQRPRKNPRGPSEIPGAVIRRGLHTVPALVGAADFPLLSSESGLAESGASFLAQPVPRIRIQAERLHLLQGIPGQTVLDLEHAIGLIW